MVLFIKKKPCSRLIYFRNVLNTRYLSPSHPGRGIAFGKLVPLSGTRFRVRSVIRGLSLTLFGLIFLGGVDKESEISNLDLIKDMKNILKFEEVFVNQYLTC
jgi:hypothetical protein